MFTSIYECVCILLIDFCYIFMCRAGIFILNMMDHKWSAYHDISSTHVERTALKLFSYFIQSIFIYSLSIIYLSKNFEVM